MKSAPLLCLCFIIASGPAFAGVTVEDQGPLGPCVESGSPGAEAQAGSGPAWGVEIATSFNKQEALDDFARVQKQYSDLLGRDSRDDADALCAKLRAQGGACVVQKN
jgi:hypothetical protein